MLCLSFFALFCHFLPFFLSRKVHDFVSFARDFAMTLCGETDEKGMLGVPSPQRLGAEGADLLCVLCFGNPHQKRGRKHRVALAPRKCRREGNAGGKPRREPMSARSAREREGTNNGEREHGRAGAGEPSAAEVSPPKACGKPRRAAKPRS